VLRGEGVGVVAVDVFVFFEVVEPCGFGVVIALAGFELTSIRSE
jgi:hypothetical protein